VDKDRVALVTGAGSGIGRATSVLLAASGYSIAMVDIAAAGLEVTAAEITKIGARSPLALVADVSSRVQIASVVEEAVERFTRIDALVTCAGHIQLVELALLSDEILDRMLDVHLKGTIFAVQAAVPAMQGRRYGRIVCISSAAASKGVVAHSHYAAAKAGIIGFAKSAARELGPYGITINCVLPGAIDTPLLGSMPSEARAQLARTPVGRIGTPNDVAHAVRFLASPDAGFITGATLLVTGGEYT
jgi:NAD(P)-dependent dehydrogenase (short-subunit alcohol dehydrogenase family)